MYVDQVNGARSIVSVTWVGRRTPFHCTASGKVLLAWMDDADRDELLSHPLERATEKTETDLAEELAFDRDRARMNAMAYEAAPFRPYGLDGRWSGTRWFSGQGSSDGVLDGIGGVPLGVHVHPTQLYEMIVELLNFAILYWMLKHKKFEGQVVGAYMFIYGVARFFLEFLRGDPGRGQLFGTWMTETQGIALAMVIAGTVIWLRRVPLRTQAQLATARSIRS